VEGLTHEPIEGIEAIQKIVIRGFEDMTVDVVRVAIHNGARVRFFVDLGAGEQDGEGGNALGLLGDKGENS
jgi:formylmethanofuran:tetrahydromethanopterin formyltransferase